jgi:hypothetical protein
LDENEKPSSRASRQLLSSEAGEGSPQLACQRGELIWPSWVVVDHRTNIDFVLDEIPVPYQPTLIPYIRIA